MENSRLVMLFGDSLLMDGVEASLRASQSLDVMRILDAVADLRKCLRSLQPDMVIFDWDTPQAQLIVSVLRAFVQGEERKALRGLAQTGGRIEANKHACSKRQKGQPCEPDLIDLVRNRILPAGDNQEPDCENAA